MFSPLVGAAALQAGSSALQAGIQLWKQISDSRLNVPKDPDRVIEVDAPDIKCFKTLENQLNNIVSFLTRGKEVKGILVHGILGAGKTSIMQNLNNHKQVAKMFEIIIWLKVSSDNLDSNASKKNFSIQELQKDVMQRLKLDIKTIPASEYKNTICEKLKEKKYLLLLDNVKDTIDINEIGFPSNWNVRNSKIVLTTRFKLVWPSIVDRYIKVELLTPEEAQRMFTNILNKNINHISRTYVLRAIKWCNRLPVAIKLVAEYFKSTTDEDSWKNALDALKSCPRYGDDMMRDMCRSMSFCCEHLSDQEKYCFYYGALYPEESNIYKDRLLDCWMADNFLGISRRYGRSILERLKNWNLFEEDDHKVCVRMHKLLRLVAFDKLQMDEKHKVLVLCSEESMDLQNCWEGKHWISLVDNINWKPISDSPGCSVLSTLFLQGNSKFKKLPDLFFEKMGSLRVLDLMGTSLESLPYSLMNSKNLAVLYLNECTKLENLFSVVGNLELLEVLDISGTGVKELPTEIQGLKHLKRFLVSSSAFSGTDNILHVISGLTKLQEMLIDTKSEKETFNWQIVDAVINNVKNLKHMTSLQFQFLNNKVVVVWKVEGDVRKFFGCEIFTEAEMHVLFQSYIKHCSGREPSSTVVRLLSMSDAPEIIAGLNDLEHLDTFDFSNSAAILVENCKKMTYILGPIKALSSLEQLYLNDMEKLESVTRSSFVLSNFGKLKILYLSRCVLLTNIITKDAEEGMMQCSTGDVQKYLVFPMLEELVLLDMPKLESIWKNELLEFPALIKVEIRNCPALKYLPISHNNTQNLKSITTERTWWEALEWKDPAAGKHFEKFLPWSSNGETSFPKT